MMQQEQDINDLAFEANTNLSIRSKYEFIQQAYADIPNKRVLSKTDNETAKITICTMPSVQFPNVAISPTTENIFDYLRNKRPALAQVLMGAR